MSAETEKNKGTGDPYDEQIASKAEAVVNAGWGVLAHLSDIDPSGFYDPKTNPKGFINLGLAETKICEDIMTAKLEEISKLPEPVSNLYYGKTDGDVQFCQSLQRFITKYFKSLRPVTAESICVANGATTVIEHMNFALLEPGDYMMLISPCYHRYESDGWQRAGTNVVAVPGLFPNPTDDDYHPDIRDEVLEEYYQQAKSQGKTIRAITITNPTNPTGDVYTAAHLQTLLEFASRHELHVVANEMYRLTVFDPEVTFTSILSLPWPDPGRVHFIWGFSKDFCLSGYSVAILHTPNPRLRRYLNCVGIYTRIPNVIARRLKLMIDDEDWLDRVWIPTMRTKTKERFDYVYQTLTSAGVKCHKSSASLFAWIDLRKFLPSPTRQGEEWLQKQLVAGGIFIIPGMASHSEVPGFFRFLVTDYPSIVEAGLKRLLDILSNLPSPSESNGHTQDDVTEH